MVSYGLSVEDDGRGREHPQNFLLTLVEVLQFFELFVGNVFEVFANHCLDFLPHTVLYWLVFGQLIEEDRDIVGSSLSSCKEEGLKLINQILGAVRLPSCTCSFFFIAEQFLLND